MEPTPGPSRAHLKSHQREARDCRRPAACGSGQGHTGHRASPPGTVLEAAGASTSPAEAPPRRVEASSSLLRELPHSRPCSTPISVRCPRPGPVHSPSPAHNAPAPLALPRLGSPGSVSPRREAHRQEGVDDVGFDGAQRLVLDDQEDLLLLLQVDEVPKPGLFGEPGAGRRAGQVRIRQPSPEPPLWAAGQLAVLTRPYPGPDSPP